MFSRAPCLRQALKIILSPRRGPRLLTAPVGAWGRCDTRGRVTCDCPCVWCCAFVKNMVATVREATEKHSRWYNQRCVRFQRLHWPQLVRSVQVSCISQKRTSQQVGHCDWSRWPGGQEGSCCECNQCKALTWWLVKWWNVLCEEWSESLEFENIIAVLEVQYLSLAKAFPQLRASLPISWPGTKENVSKTASILSCDVEFMLQCIHIHTDVWCRYKPHPYSRMCMIINPIAACVWFKCEIISLFPTGKKVLKDH